MIVLLRPPPAVDFLFRAGQYVDILLPGDDRRSFSIASPPHDARLLELHVRVADGELTPWWFADAGRRAAALPDAAGQDSLVTIEGPLGRFYYREAATQPRPLLLVGGGTGIAPLLSILRHLVGAFSQRRLILYWGVRGSRDLYAEVAILELMSRASGMRYVPVLSEPEPTWTGRTGFVHGAVLEDMSDLGDCDIYAAGPPAMIEVVRSEFPRRGARVERLYCDSHA
jgi:CDP-4-dehydro-6-deoxyglucose reductase